MERYSKLAFGQVAPVVLGGILLVVGGNSARAAGPTTVKIGLIASLSGYVASYGIDERDGALLAIDQINRTNAIPGVRLEPVTLDDKGDPTATVEAVQQALGQGVVAILGPTTTGGTAATATLVTGKKIPAIAFGILPSNLQTNPPAYGFSLGIDPKGEAEGDVDVALQQHVPIKSVAIIYDTNAYGQSISDALKAYAATKGLSIAASEAFKSTDTDMTPQLTRIRNAKPDFIFEIGGGTAPALIARQKFELGMPQLLLISTASFGIGDKKFAEIAGPGATPSVRHAAFAAQVWDSLPRANPRREKLRKLAQDFQKMYNRPMIGYTPPAGFDSAWVLAAAMKQAGSTDPEKIQAALDKTNYSGTLCQAQFSPSSHSACHANALVSAKMVNGKLEYGT